TPPMTHSSRNVPNMCSIQTSSINWWSQARPPTLCPHWPVQPLTLITTVHSQFFHPQSTIISKIHSSQNKQPILNHSKRLASCPMSRKSRKSTAPRTTTLRICLPKGSHSLL